MGKAREDDPSIVGDVRLWRRIPNWRDHSKYDDKLKRRRPSSINFRDDRFHELSVNIAIETSIERVLEGYSGFGLVEITAELAREILAPTIIICRDASADNPGHALICGNVTRGQAEKLAKKCQWVVEPVNPPQSAEIAADSVDLGPAEVQQTSHAQNKSRSLGWLPTLLAVLLILIAVVIGFFFL